MLTTILAFVVVLGVLIFVHELGHFLTAKAVDIEVPRFSIGLGPVAWGFRRGETEYVISWLPLGGYVKMAGMEEMEKIEGGPARSRVGRDAVSDVGLVREEGRADGRTFESKSLLARALVISSGVIMNFLFAIVVFALIGFVWGVRPEQEPRVDMVVAERLPAGTETLAEIAPGARVVAVGERRIRTWRDLEQALILAQAGPVEIRFEDAPPVTISMPADDEARGALILSLLPLNEPVIATVVDGMPAEDAGLAAGDRVIAVDGRPVETWQQMAREIEARPGEPTELRIRRADRDLGLTIVPVADTVAFPEGERVVGRIGIGQVTRERLGAVAAARHGLAETGRWTMLILRVLRDLITGQISPRQLGGPILIGQVSGDAARAGLEPLLSFMALLSVNLAVLNLLPIPILDGGHLLFLGVEAVRGRALTVEQRMRFSQVGLVIIVAIMVWAFASDLLRIFGL